MRNATSLAILASTLVGCAGGGPLLHPAKTLPSGAVRAALGVSAQVSTGEAAESVREARARADSDPNVPGAPGTNEPYARGALVVASMAPGLAPFVAARVGLGSSYEGGLAYTGRGARADARRSFDVGNDVSLSIGAGLSTAFYGESGSLPNVDLEQLRGIGADVPFLVGWESKGGIYQAWAGVRAGYEHVALERVRSEPKSVTFGDAPLKLSADRFFGGALVGLAIGFRHLHVAMELDASFHSVSGTYNETKASVRALLLTPGTAVWWRF